MLKYYQNNHILFLNRFYEDLRRHYNKKMNIEHVEREYLIKYPSFKIKTEEDDKCEDEDESEVEDDSEDEV